MDLSSSGPVLTCATVGLTSPEPVLNSPGESWRYTDKDWNTEKFKTDSGLEPSWPAKTIETDIFEVLICFFDALWETSNMVFVLIHFIYL